MIQRHCLYGFLQFGLLGLLGCLGVSAFTSKALAQSVPSNILSDDKLGIESSQIVPNFNGLPVEAIGGGAVRGINLFHSFQEFNVSAGRAAYFFSPSSDIQNILARVTGSNRSDILGTIGTFGNSAPNLFLLNPNGIVFGQSASLDVGGSFVATTANAVKLGDNGLFDASEPSKSNLLTVNPSAFLFNSIANQGIINSSTTGLQVPEGRSLLLVGGNVSFDGGIVNAPGGRVELGGIATSGTVGLNVDANNLGLSFPDNVPKANISLANRATVDVTGIAGGSVQIQGDRIQLSNVSTINSTTAGNQNGGEISIRASQLELTTASSINTITAGIGEGSDINIKTGSLTLQDNSAFSTGSLFAPGKAGDIIIEATDFVNLINQSNLGTLSLGTGDATTTSGAGGNISIKTQNLSLTNLSGIAVSTFLGKGNAGSLSIQAANSVNLDNNSTFVTSSFGAGTGGEIFLDTKTLRLLNDSTIITSTADPREFDFTNLFQSINPNLFDPRLAPIINNLIRNIQPENVGKSNSGNVVINASDSVEIVGASNQSIILTDTLTAGNGGNITINTVNFRTRNGVLISTGTRPGSQGQGGNLAINALDTIEIIGTSTDEQPISGLSTQTQGSGDSGNLQLTARRLIVRDRAIVSTSTDSQGKGGNLTVIAPDFVEINGGTTTNQSFTSLTTATNASGDAGNLKINTGQLRVLNRGSVLTSALDSSQGKGGDLIVTATDSVLLSDRGNLSTETLGAGRGGNMQIAANSLSLNNQASMRARSLAEGKAGNIDINLRDTLQANDSSITTAAIQSGGGDISVTSKNIRLRNNSDIRTNLSTGQGSGGNIFLSGNAIIALEDSDIFAFAPEGQGGNITFNTRAFLSNPLYRPTQTSPDTATLQSLNGNNRVDVNASGAISSGNIAGIPDITFLQNSLTELPENPIDTNALIAKSCIARRNNRQNGTFFITGSGGLPERPGDAPISDFSTSTVQSAPTQNRQTWKIGGPIIEPTGVYQLENGQRLLSRECN